VEVIHKLALWNYNSFTSIPYLLFLAREISFLQFPFSFISIKRLWHVVYTHPLFLIFLARQYFRTISCAYYLSCTPKFQSNFFAFFKSWHFGIIAVSSPFHIYYFSRVIISELYLVLIISELFLSLKNILCFLSLKFFYLQKAFLQDISIVTFFLFLFWQNILYFLSHKCLTYAAALSIYTPNYI